QHLLDADLERGEILTAGAERASVREGEDGDSGAGIRILRVRHRRRQHGEQDGRESSGEAHDRLLGRAGDAQGSTRPASSASTRAESAYRSANLSVRNGATLRTSCGRRRFSVEPSPTCPNRLKPQQAGRPSTVIAQV